MYQKNSGKYRRIVGNSGINGDKGGSSYLFFYGKIKWEFKIRYETLK